MHLRESIFRPRQSRAAIPTLLKRAIAIGLMVVLGATVIGATMIAASPSPSSSQAPATSASANVSATASVAVKPAQGAISNASRLANGPAVITFLSQVIGWYRHLPVEERLITDPVEMLFVAEDRQMAGQVLDLSFEFAKADAALLGTTA